MSTQFGRFLGGIYSAFGHRFPAKMAFEAYVSRPFSAAGKKMLFLFCPDNVVAFSQLYPFLFYEGDIQSKYEVSVRAAPFGQPESDQLHNADVVCVQTGFNLDCAQADQLFHTLRQRHPKAKFVYFDWFAPLDLRLAKAVNRHIDLYVKRQVFRDIKHYERATLGDTNLMDHYCRKYQLEASENLFEVPATFYPKLHLGAGLFTGAYLLRGLAKRRLPQNTKTISVHARLGQKGSPWYTAMRDEAAQACRKIEVSGVVQGNGVSRKQYLQELSQSKICFSPFGYGEVCWRDFEATLFGSLLIKPDMGHLKTDPDIYVDNETYISVAWDYADLSEKVAFYSRNALERDRIVDNARQVLRDYVQRKLFLKQMAPIFNLAHGRPAANPTLYPAQFAAVPRDSHFSPNSVAKEIAVEVGDGIRRHANPLS